MSVEETREGEEAVVVEPEVEEEAAAAVEPSRWRTLVIVAVALSVGLIAGALFFGGGDSGEAPAGGEDAHAAAGEGGEETVWTCSMHPQIRSDEPGQCPICGMDLIPVGNDGGEAPEPDEVRLTKRAKALAQIRTVPVQRAGGGGADLRLLGRLDYDETQMRTVTPWIGGRIDKLHVDTTGEKVKKGQVIATLYSPEVYAAHQDLLVAARQARELSEAQSFARESAQATLRSARQKLRLLGVPESEIAAMEKADKPWEHVRIRSPFNGTVLERMVSEGTYVTAGTGLYRIADLETLWVQLDAYEPDLSRLEKGQTVTLKVSSLPGERFEGRVAFIDPVVDRRTRTARVRVEVDSQDGRLRPGMFAEAIVEGEPLGDVDTPQPLVIPESAPLFSGRRSIVYVEVPDTERPTYEAREVRLGTEMNDLYPVVAGLNEGERVVVHGAFALDADLQIKGGESLMMRGDDLEQSPLDEVLLVSDDFRQGLLPVVDHYLSVQKALAGDDLASARAAAEQVQSAATGFSPEEPDEAARAWTKQRAELSEESRRLAQAGSLEDARGAFEKLSGALTRVLQVFGNPTDQTLQLAYCPMAADDQGAAWLQVGETIDNAYMGSRMLRCGEIRQAIPSGGHLIIDRPATEAAAGDPHAGHQH